MLSKLISVITPSLNSGAFLEDAIKSVLAQDYAHFEHIVVDGGSEDASLEVLSKYPHVRWISEPDSGQSDAMNKGFGLSRGEIIVYLNADDYFKPGAFEAVAAEFADNAKFVVGRIEILTADGQSHLNDPKVELTEMLRWWQPNAYCCNPAGYFYERSLQERLGGFNVRDHLTMDYEFLIGARQLTPFRKIDRTLACFRLFPGTKTYENSQHEPLTFARFNNYLTLVDESERRKILEEKQAFFGQSAP